MLLLKNPQFLPNHCKTMLKQATHEYLILNDWIKIVDFLIKAYFWLSPDSPLHVCISIKIQEVSQVNFKNVSNYIVLHIWF